MKFLVLYGESGWVWVDVVREYLCGSSACIGVLYMYLCANVLLRLIEFVLRKWRLKGKKKN